MGDLGRLPGYILTAVIAGYFGVSIDTLFEYDADRLAAVIEDIHRNYTECFWNEPERAEKILLDGIARYPSADRLKADLVELYVQYPARLLRRGVVLREQGHRP